MKEEIKSATNFLIHLMKLSSEIENEKSQNKNSFFRLYHKVMYKRKLKKLHSQLKKDLQKRFNHRWFPESPFRASVYRRIRIKDGYLDPLIVESAMKCGLGSSNLMLFLPETLSIWIDPGLVQYSLEDPWEHIYTLYNGEGVWKRTSQ